ncbi:uncharacterized protein METZ01_LOCUS380728 [marine metagenome]|uniref:Uncharacterized protein n=1 Tax=marine metagenome TaxID=408172 RepID=A0A382U0M1_9ZZZZ
MLSNSIVGIKKGIGSESNIQKERKIDKKAWIIIK